MSIKIQTTLFVFNVAENSSVRHFLIKSSAALLIKKNMLYKGSLLAGLLLWDTEKRG